MACQPTKCIETKVTAQTVYLADVPINLSQVSETGKIDIGYLSRILSGDQKPGLKTARRLAESLGMGLEDLLSAIEAPKRKETM